MPLPTYTATPARAKALARRIRRLYRRWPIGLGILFLSLAGIAGLNLFLAGKAGPGAAAEALLLGLVPDVLLGITALLGWALAVSSGRLAVRFSHQSERCTLTGDALVWEYRPAPAERSEYARVVWRMPYRTVTRVLDEPRLGRLVLYGDYTMEYYGSPQDTAPLCTTPAVDSPLLLHGYFEDFDQLKADLLCRLPAGAYRPNDVAL